MAINAEVAKSNNENSMNVIRRFNKKVQESGVLVRAKGKRYAERKPSKATRQKRKLRSLKNKDAYETAVRLGKIMPTTNRRR